MHLKLTNKILSVRQSSLQKTNITDEHNFIKDHTGVITSFYPKKCSLFLKKNLLNGKTVKTTDK